MTHATTGTLIDVREIGPGDRHATIFEAFRALGAGRFLEILSDHDPKPLHHQFQAEAPGAFAWAYAQNGPDLWRVRINKLADAHRTGGCCGACGGGS